MKELLTLITIICISMHGASQDYTVIGYHSEYEEIEDYESLQVRNLGNIQASTVFELEFEFPYFDSAYDTLFFNNDGLISVPGSVNFCIRMFNFIYNWDDVTNPDDIPSDIRYKHTTVDGMKAFVIQYTRVRFDSDTSIEEFDSHLSFQYWLFEDGTIEFKMGPSNLDNSSVYTPGEGFLYLVNSTYIPIAVQLGVDHPLDDTRQHSIEDFEDYSSFEFRNDHTGTLSWVPAAGWTYRFTNLLVSTVDDEVAVSTQVYPNPATEQVTVSSEAAVTQWQIIDLQGVEQLRGVDKENIDISRLAAGIYTLKVVTERGTEAHKLLKQ